MDSTNGWLEHLGLDPAKVAFLTPPELVERALASQEGQLTDTGSLRVNTGRYTGRCPERRFLVSGGASDDSVDWGKTNKPISSSEFESLWSGTLRQLASVGGLHGFEGSAGADSSHAVGVRLVSTMPWQALFSACLFRDPVGGVARNATILAAGNLPGPGDEPLIAIDLERARVLILGTRYAGEIKKSVFSFLNWWLPGRGVMPMHCSATVGRQGDVALYFGLSGTGKTTLSADPERLLVGDDEHGWSGEGIFNFEGGCYAKTIHLTRQGEPLIWDSIGFGTVLENVPLDPVSRTPDFNSSAITENTRVAYPLSRVAGAQPGGKAGHPDNILFLTCDAFGVLPAVSLLDRRQALEQFLLGYTAKVGGTESGVREVSATFSSGFGAPFLPRRPLEYAALLAERLARHGSRVWLVNTGWSGGSASGGVGRRMPLAVTRAIVSRILDGSLAKAEWVRDPVFGLGRPKAVAGIEPRHLDPCQAWANPDDYLREASALALKFSGKLDGWRGEIGKLAENSKSG
ncbi:MAG: phosphoenolpyruvate carboxykinase (ATP) [Planctomycetota bacterium]